MACVSVVCGGRIVTRRRSTILPKYPPAEVTFALIASGLAVVALTLGMVLIVRML